MWENPLLTRAYILTVNLRTLLSGKLSACRIMFSYLPAKLRTCMHAWTARWILSCCSAIKELSWRCNPRIISDILTCMYIYVWTGCIGVASSHQNSNWCCTFYSLCIAKRNRLMFGCCAWWQSTRTFFRKVASQLSVLSQGSLSKSEICLLLCPCTCRLLKNS